MSSRYNRKKRGYKRPGYKSCGRMVYNDAAKALSLARQVKQMINVEYKFFDSQFTGGAENTTPKITKLTNILQGDGGSSRDGNQVKVVGIYLNYLCTIHASATTTQVRVLLVLDKQTNGVIYTAANLLKDVTVTDNIISPYNLNNKYRFHVLYDKVHRLNDNGNQSITVKKYMKVNEKIRYTAEAGDITDLSSSSYSLMTFSNEATNSPAFTMHVRLRYVDN